MKNSRKRWRRRRRRKTRKQNKESNTVCLCASVEMQIGSHCHKLLFRGDIVGVADGQAGMAGWREGVQ